MRQLLTFACIILTSTMPLRAEINIQEVTSPGGINAWYVNEPSIPMVSIAIGWRGASMVETDEQLGATYLMTGLLEEGAGDMDAITFKRTAEGLAASFGFDSSRENITISAQFLKENADEVINLLNLAITKPAFTDAAFERTKNQVLSIVARRGTDPQDIASDTFNKIAYAGHPYARPFQGTPETIASFTQQDMRDIHAKTMTKDRMFVGVVGDITGTEVGAMLDRLLGELPETGPELPQAVTFQAAGGVTVVDLDVPQSVAIWGHEGILQSDPDFFAAFVMNRILGGGGFTSRLTNEVREKRGLTYGVYSYLASLDYGQYYGGSVSSANDRIGEAIAVIRAEWARMADGGITDAELEAAIKYMTGNYPLRFDGNAQIAGLLRYSQMDDFPIDYPAKRNDYIRAVTREDVARVAKRLLREDDMRFVVVGKPAGVEATD